MQFSALQIFLAALIGTAVASPLLGLPVRRADALAARQGYPSFPGFGGSDYYSDYYGYSGGDASTGNSGNVNGGNVVNDAGAAGAVSNAGASCES